MIYTINEDKLRKVEAIINSQKNEEKRAFAEYVIEELGLPIRYGLDSDKTYIGNEDLD